MPTATTTTAVAAEAARRRTFAVISHPDAGKSTITEALALHAQVIGEAGAVHGKAGRRGVVSDWMAMEQQRGISITSAVLQFAYRDLIINLLDTPGHADFSEDTYRVLTAVDCAVMLLDAAKGLEPQTLKLFEVCRARQIPVITFINKWDRPGQEPLALLDEIEQRIKLRPTPITWPVGIAGEFHGVIDRRTGEMTAFHRTPGGATAAVEEQFDPRQAAQRYGEDWRRAVEELELLALTGATTTRRPSPPPSPHPCCSARQWPTSEYDNCSTCSPATPPHRRRARTRTVNLVRSTRRSPASCSRSRRT
ncbi:GTP-binding protein [Micromonospora tarensis]|uniref:GTP-binding protein n=1 Tax=Micromonospora tarensis TaxID=2806100 RepID=UPI002814D525|nr:GTP-binding protein [Micromonospora tarensis]